MRYGRRIARYGRRIARYGRRIALHESFGAAKWAEKRHPSVNRIKGSLQQWSIVKSVLFMCVDNASVYT